MSTQDSKEPNVHSEKSKQIFAALNSPSYSCEESWDGPKLGVAAIGVATIAAALTSCRKEGDQLFELNEVGVSATSADKGKRKSTEQFVSILYTNLFQTAISSDIVFKLNECFESVGDQDIAREVLISNFFNNEGVQLPSQEEMNADIDTFIQNTYKRFFVRMPSEAEKTWVKNFIESNPFMTPELVFFSFALSNEYLFY